MIVFPLMADSVILYTREAEVYRSVSLPRGDKFEIYGLPYNPSGLRIWTSSGYVASYSLRDTVLPFDRERYDSLKLLLRILNRQISYTSARYARMKYERELLLSYTSKEVREPAKNLLSLSRTVERATYAMDSLKAVSDSLTEVKKRLEREIKDLQAPQKILTVKLRDFRGGKLSVVYRVQASWSPIYVFKAYPDSGKLKMEAVAEAENHSTLPIATKRAVVSTSLPPEYSPPKHYRWILRDVNRPLRKSLEEEEVVAAVSEYAAPVIPQFNYVATRYEYRGKVVIPQRGKAKAQIPLFRRTYEAEYLTTAYPEINPKAYISAVFTPDEDLTSGMATVYLDNEMTAHYHYLGERRGVPDTLFVGYDPFITGEVKLLSQKRRDRRKGKKLFVVETRVEEIVVKNGRKRPVDLTIHVRKPFAGGTVNIHYVRFKPKPKRDLGDGLMMWQVKLKPGETFKIRREMRVEYLKGGILNW